MDMEKIWYREISKLHTKTKVINRKKLVILFCLLWTFVNNAL